MQRQFNRVRYVSDGQFWYISNYDFKMYQYLTRKYGEDNLVISNNLISFCDSILTPQDRELLIKQLRL